MGKATRSDGRMDSIDAGRPASQAGLKSAGALFTRSIAREGREDGAAVLP
jgi:hypothetical protein